MRRDRFDFAAIALIALAVLRIVSTYNIFSATYDESTHVSAGLEVLGQHHYTLQYENPPLPRVIFAIAPYLAGVRYEASTPKWLQVMEVFYANGRYKTNLFLSRMGNLLFFLIAAAATWWWGRRELGSAGGCLVALLFTMQPVVIGYSGLATHEAPAMAGLAVSILAFLRWIEQPSAGRAAMVGAAWAFAILCKMSALGYVPVACAAIYAVRLVRDAEVRRRWRELVRLGVIAPTVCALMIWAGYAFTVGRMGAGRYPDALLPAPAFFLGILRLIQLNGGSWTSYLFGETSNEGWWYYFPVAVALKTTIVSLLLGLGALFVRRVRVAQESLAAAVAILATAMPSHLDIGIRFVLPMFVPLTIAAATSAWMLLESGRTGARVAAIALLVWHCGASIAAHPDEFPYFNEIAARDPSRYLIDSNLDWGQDALRLRRVVREQHIDRIGLDILGVHDFNKMGFPPNYKVTRDVPATGWVAVSETTLRIFHGYEWLAGKPFQRVGKSIRLYHLQ